MSNTCDVPLLPELAGEASLGSVGLRTFNEVGVGSRAVTYAYPRFSNTQDDDSQKVEFNSSYYAGYIREYLPKGRDRILLPGPCYQTCIHIHAGASGGPVFGSHGLAFGINSTRIDGTDISYVSRISEVRASAC
jgi:hypothetical protein